MDSNITFMPIYLDEDYNYSLNSFLLDKQRDGMECRTPIPSRVGSDKLDKISAGLVDRMCIAFKGIIKF